MTVSEITSTADLRRMQKQLRRRVLRHKFATSTVLVVRAGGYFKARYKGQSDVAFGVDEQQAVQRLQKLPNMVRAVCLPKRCDVAADRAERRAEAAASKAVRKSVKFDPKRG